MAKLRTGKRAHGVDAPLACRIERSFDVMRDTVEKWDGLVK